MTKVELSSYIVLYLITPYHLGLIFDYFINKDNQYVSINIFISVVIFVLYMMFVNDLK